MRFEHLTEGMRKILMSWTRGYTAWVVIYAMPDKVPGILERWADEFGTRLPAHHRHYRPFVGHGNQPDPLASCEAILCHNCRQEINYRKRSLKNAPERAGRPGRYPTPTQPPKAPLRPSYRVSGALQADTNPPPPPPPCWRGSCSPRGRGAGGKPTPCTPCQSVPGDGRRQGQAASRSRCARALTPPLAFRLPRSGGRRVGLTLWRQTWVPAAPPSRAV